MYSQLVHGVPPVFDHFVENMKALHSVLVFVSVKHLPVSSIPNEERFLVRRVGGKRYRMYRVVVRYGYWDALIEHKNFEALLMESLEGTIKSSACDERLELGLVTKRLEQGSMNGNCSESEEVISEAPLMIISNDNQYSIERAAECVDEAMEEELEQEKKCLETVWCRLRKMLLSERSSIGTNLFKLSMQKRHHGF